jgi:hypothetical protein
MGQGQDPQGELARFALAEFTGGLAGLEDGCRDFGGIELNNPSVAFFDLLEHQSLLCGVKG